MIEILMPLESLLTGKVRFVYILRLLENYSIIDSNTLTFVPCLLRNGSIGLPANSQEPHGPGNLQGEAARR